MRSLRAELSEALAADLSERPQRCGHSSDPMCCPFENFPTLAEFFTTPATAPVLIHDHAGIDCTDPWSYSGPCPRCGVCKFIGHGPLCIDCYAKAAR